MGIPEGKEKRTESVLEGTMIASMSKLTSVPGSWEYRMLIRHMPKQQQKFTWAYHFQIQQIKVKKKNPERSQRANTPYLYRSKDKNYVLFFSYKNYDSKKGREKYLMCWEKNPHQTMILCLEKLSFSSEGEIRPNELSFFFFFPSRLALKEILKENFWRGGKKHLSES